MLLKGHILKNG